MLSRLFALCLFLAASQLLADDESPSTSSVDHAVLVDGEKVSGHVGACLVSLGDRPLAGFGLTKSPDSKGEYTFLLVFKTGGKKFEGSGSGAEVNSDGKKSSYKITFEVGDVEIPLDLETVLDESQKLVSSKIVIGGKELTDKKARVVAVDLTGPKPTYQVLKAELPTSVPNLADDDSYVPALKKAIEELKKQSPEIAKLID